MRPEAIAEAVHRGLPASDGVVVRENPQRATGRGYYRSSCFKSFAAFAGTDGGTFEIGDGDGDGGDVDWTARFTSNGKERCFISGLGVDRIALLSPSSAR